MPILFDSKVGEIADNIHTEFANTIRNLDWLDNSTKTNALRKLSSLTKHVGYPELFESTYALDKYYENVRFQILLRSSNEYIL